MTTIIIVGDLRAVAIKHVVELSVEDDYSLPLFFSKRKICHATPGHTLLPTFPSFRPLGIVGEACLISADA